LETFARFATRLDEKTRATIERGRRVREVLKQQEQHPLTTIEQIALLKAVTEGLFDDLMLDQIAGAEQTIREAVTEKLEQIGKKIETGEPLSDEDWNRFMQVLNEAVEDWRINNGNT